MVSYLLLVLRLQAILVSEHSSANVLTLSANVLTLFLLFQEYASLDNEWKEQG
jgi:hypothetical protein